MMPVMMPVPITAMTAVSALGIGRAAHLAALKARRTGLTPNDFDAPVGGWVGRVAGVEEHSLPEPLARFDCRNNRLADMALRADGFTATIEAARERYGAHRIGVVVGTSTSGVAQAEGAWLRLDSEGRLPDDFNFEATQDLGSLAAFLRAGAGVARPSQRDLDRLCLLRTHLHRWRAAHRLGPVRRRGGRRRRQPVPDDAARVRRAGTHCLRPDEALRRGARRHLGGRGGGLRAAGTGRRTGRVGIARAGAPAATRTTCPNPTPKAPAPRAPWPRRWSALVSRQWTSTG